jgi:protein ImuB
MVARPELKGHAIVLTEPHPRGGERVVHCSRAAHALGARAGMTVAEAMTLAGQRAESRGRRAEGKGSPNLQSEISSRRSLKSLREDPNPKFQIPNPQFETLPADPIADRDALIQLAYWCHRFSPTVGLEEAERPECLLLDVSGIGPLFGGEDHLLEQAARALGARGYRPRLALADTIGAAWAKAHFEISSRSNSKSQIPNPQSPIPNSKFQILNSKFQIPNLPLAALRLPAETIDLFAQLGIYSMKQLAELPRAQLESRFGPLPLLRLDQALGRVGEIFQPLHPPPGLSAEQAFEIPTAEPEVLRAVVEKLLSKIIRPLVAQGRGATQLACRFNLEGSPPMVLDVGLYRPTATV